MTIRFSSAGLFCARWRSSGRSAGTRSRSKLAASPGSQRSPARRREILDLALLMARLQAAFYAEALKDGRLTGERHQFASVVGAQERTHVTFLADALGPHASNSPRFQFGDATTIRKIRLDGRIPQVDLTRRLQRTGRQSRAADAGGRGADRIVEPPRRVGARARRQGSSPGGSDMPIGVGEAKGVLAPFLAWRCPATVPDASDSTISMSTVGA